MEKRFAKILTASLLASKKPKKVTTLGNHHQVVEAPSMQTAKRIQNVIPRLVTDYPPTTGSEFPYFLKCRYIIQLLAKRLAEEQAVHLRLRVEYSKIAAFSWARENMPAEIYLCLVSRLLIPLNRYMFSVIAVSIGSRSMLDAPKNPTTPSVHSRT